MIFKRSVTISGHRTSLSLETPFWDELKIIANRREISLSALIASVDAVREQTSNLSSALRLLVLMELRSRA